MGFVNSSPALLPRKTKKYKKGYYIPDKKSKNFKRDLYFILCFILCFLIILFASVYLYIIGVIS